MNILLLKDIINSFFHNHYIVAVVKVLLIEYIYLLNKKIKNVTCLSNVFLLYHTSLSQYLISVHHFMFGPDLIPIQQTSHCLP